MLKKKFLSLLVAFATVFTLLPTTIFAAETTNDLSNANNWISDRTEPNAFEITDNTISFSVKEQPAATNWYAWQGRKAYTSITASSYWKVSYTMNVNDTMLNQNNVNASLWIQVDKEGTNGAESQKDCVDWAIVQFINQDNGPKWQTWNSSGSGSWNDVTAVAATKGDYTIDVEFFEGTITQKINGVEVNTYTISEKKTSPAALIAQGKSYGAAFDVAMSVPTVDTILDAVTVSSSEELQSAINNAAADAVITLAPGEYNAPITINRSVTLKGSVSSKSTDAIDSVIGSTISINESNIDVVLDQLAFTKGGNISSSYNNEGTNLTVQNCVAKDLTGTFVYTSGDTTKRLGKVTVKDNVVENITSNNASAFNLWNASEHEITGNYVDNVNYHAFNLDSTVGNVLFENNTVKNTGKGALQLANYTIGDSVIIRGNTFENTANRPYYNDDEAQGLNYAAVRIYSSGANTDKGITANIDITENTFVGNPISVWVSCRKTEGETTTYYPVNVQVNKNTFDFTDTSIYGVYASVDEKTPVDASENYWDSETPNLKELNTGVISIENYYIDETLTEKGIIDENGVARVDNSALQAIVDKYEAEGLSKEEYTADSWAAYEKAMTAAKNILNNLDATKEAIDAAKADVEKAYSELTYVAPSIISGANSTWQLGSEKGLTITSDAAYKNFVKVTMDGKDVDQANYTVAQGSTIVTLNAAYLNTLTEGTHEVAIVSTTGTATTKLTIAKAASTVTTPQNKPNTTTPSTATDKEETVDTGVFNATSIMTMWALVGLGFAVTIALKKKVNE